MRRDLRLLLAFQGLHTAFFIMPVIVVFWQRGGLDLTQVMLLQAFFSLATIALEVPTGYVADVLGRKRSLVAGCAVSFAGMTAYAVGTGFWTFLAAELVLALGLSLVSGTDTALLYDALRAEGRSADFTRIQGRFFFTSQVSQAGASVLGGFLGDWHLRIPFYATAAAMLGALVCVSLVREPPRERTLSRTDHRGNLRTVWRSMLRDRAVVARTVVLTALLSSATLQAVWLYQPHWQWVGIELRWFGLLWAGVNLAIAFVARSAYRVESVLGRHRTLLVMAGLPGLAYAALGRIPHAAAAAFALPFALTRGLTATLLRDELNRHADSDSRATINSIANLGTRVVFSLTTVPIGWVGDQAGVPAALLASALLYGLLCPIGWLLWDGGRPAPQPAASPAGGR